MTGPVTRSKAKAGLATSALNAQVTSVSPNHTHQVLDSLQAFTEPSAPVPQSDKAFLLTLPVEMIHRICSIVFNHNEITPARDCYTPPNGYRIELEPRHSREAKDRATLANLGTTCRVMREITLPMLYQNITVYHGFLQGEMMYDLTRSLLENASLGPLVRTLDLASLLPWPSIKDHPNDGITDAQTSLMTTLARRFIGPEAASEILKNRVGWMRKAPPSAWFAADAFSPCLLLCMTPNITSVKMIAQDIWDSNFLAVQQPGSRTLQPRVVFNNLTTLHLRAKKIELSTLGGLLAASPNLKTLTLMGASGWNPSIPVVKLSNLTTLTLDECQLCIRGINYMIKCCTNLVNFSYVQVDNSECNPHHTRWFDTESAMYRFEKWRSPTSILDYLRTFAATLESVEIKFLANFGNTIPKMKAILVEGGLIKTVAGFPTLKTLRISEVVIDRKNNDDVLVNLIKDCPSLETLDIQGINTKFPERDVAQLVRSARESQFPKLRTVKLKSDIYQINKADLPFGSDLKHDQDFLPDLGVIDKGSYKEIMSSLGINLVLEYEPYVMVYDPHR
ncbi:hypothetical protein B0T18DRAFT_461852 [Schizothecium vesticola]|uniref:F-box domain-containing protein n=1 Tax=Schizothecium vesticola TaxID=314040 RepID=A0AA40F2P2_9PEZI|nr:hypothetical protein B0T18DRAFT_461852 [Schizothecium vesticola]